MPEEASADLKVLCSVNGALLNKMEMMGCTILVRWCVYDYAYDVPKMTFTYADFLLLRVPKSSPECCEDTTS